MRLQARFSLDNAFTPLLIKRFMPTSPKCLLRLEGLIVFLAAIMVYRGLGDSWLRFAVLFLVPDIFMAGYFFGARLGAMVYNIGHTYITPSLFAVAFWFAHATWLFFVPVIWIAHIGFDRVLGFGLKYPAAFKETHLGKV
jgi:hypothetical protein